MADMDALRKLIPFKPLTFSAIAGRDTQGCGSEQAISGAASLGAGKAQKHIYANFAETFGEVAGTGALTFAESQKGY